MWNFSTLTLKMKVCLNHITKHQFQTPINPKVINPQINPFTYRQVHIQTAHKNNPRQLFQFLVFFPRVQSWLIIQNFNRLVSTEAHTEMSNFCGKCSSTLIGFIVSITCFSAKMTKLPYMEIFWTVFKFTQHTMNPFITSYGRKFNCIQKQCKAKPSNFYRYYGSHGRSYLMHSSLWIHNINTLGPYGPSVC